MDTDDFVSDVMRKTDYCFCEDRNFRNAVTQVVVRQAVKEVFGWNSLELHKILAELECFTIISQVTEGPFGGGACIDVSYKGLKATVFAGLKGRDIKDIYDLGFEYKYELAAYFIRAAIEQFGDRS